MIRALLPLCLAACVSEAEILAKIDEVGDDTGGDDTGDTDALPAPVLRDIEPAWVSTRGGEEVVLRGDGLDTARSAKIGGLPASILAIEDGAVRVAAPRLPPGFADVEISTRGGSDSVANGVYVWEDGTGRTGALGAFARYDTIGGYWSRTSQADLWVVFLDPSPAAFSDVYGTAFNRCVSGYELDLARLERIQTGARRLELAGASGSIAAFSSEADTSIFRVPGLLPGDKWIAKDSLTLRPLEGDERWPRFELPAAFVTDVEAPQILEPDLDASTAPFLQSDFTLRWVPGDGDYVVVELTRYVGDGSVEEARCLLDDDGIHEIGAAPFAGWTLGEQLTIAIGRVKVGSALLPYNHARAELATSRFVVGAGYQWL